MIALIFIILGIYWVSVHWGDGAGVAAIFLAVGGLIWLGCSLAKRDRKAWHHRQEYWAKDGVERAKQNIKWREEAKAEITAEREHARRTVSRADIDKAYSDAYIAERDSIRRAHGEKLYSEELAERAAQRSPVRNVPYLGSQTEMGRMFQTNNPGQKVELFICPRCGREVRTQSKRVMYGDKVMREYICPRCRIVIRTGI